MLLSACRRHADLDHNIRATASSEPAARPVVAILPVVLRLCLRVTFAGPSTENGPARR